MPIYEFCCSACGAVFEKLVWKTGVGPDLGCPACGSARIEEQFSSFASVTRGGGSSAAAGPSCAPSGG